jgi:hypothetical protein
MSGAVLGPLIASDLFDANETSWTFVAGGGSYRGDAFRAGSRAGLNGRRICVNESG